MTYCTLEDLKLAIPEETLISLTDDEGAGVIDTDKIDEAVASAAAEIDGWCESRYTVPFVTVPALVKKFAVDIAIYNLYSRWSEKIPETRAERYKQVQKTLESISRGSITLGSAEVPTGSSGTTVSANDRLFTRTTMRRF